MEDTFYQPLTPNRIESIIKFNQFSARWLSDSDEKKLILKGEE